ncbi:MAG: hypothetical protein MUF81_18735 [Verrucomicrobia bacterium]|jgi:uncharacterized paraquat-inducible protein A|nr:hypothetical protein [Verrucomicrobiota bacterium]
MTKPLPGQCRECGGQFEFPAEAAGTTADCPHCGKPTELLLAAPPQESAIPLKTIVYTGIAILILVGGLVAAMIALKRAERMTGRNLATPTAVSQPPAAPTPPRPK